MGTLLYNNSCYNLLESSISISKLIYVSKKLGYHSVGLCDEGGMFGAIEFFNLAKRENIKPLIGISIQTQYKDSCLHFCIYAKNQEGYLALMYLSSLATSNKVIRFIDLFKYEDNLEIILLFDSKYFEDERDNLDYNSLEIKLKTLTSNNEFYFGISNQHLKFNQGINNLVRKFAHNNGIKCIALPRALYPLKSDSETLKALTAIKLQTTLNDTRISVGVGMHMLSKEEIEIYYSDNEIKNADLLAENCQYDLNIPQASLPKYQNNNELSSKSYLISLCKKGLAKRLNNKIPKIYMERLESELKVITKMDFQDYFLLVYDFILFAKRNEIVTGPGRGSAAGSLVSYCLGITHVDPIKYKLLFERFLNPERISMPDIDTDISDVGRDRVVEYLFSKYQNSQISHIITFGTFKARQAIRDIAKVYGVNLAAVDHLAKTIPNDLSINLTNLPEKSTRFAIELKKEPLFQKIYQMAKEIEYLPRHISTHAAGIVLSDKAIYNYVPITYVNDLVSTQYKMDHLEQFGLIKMDLLGLTNLTTIAEICREVGINNVYSIPLNDQDVYKNLALARTSGVFQLESVGMRRLLKKLVPTDFEDIVAILALYRPGPMQNIDLYLNNRKSPSLIDYGHPDLKEILMNTHGVMIYQEQIMQVTQKMAGFTLGKADILRKAISKKNEKEIISLKADFINGCLNNGHTLEMAEKIFSMIEKFANYGFNRSHSVAYAMVAYQCAYLKTKYPLSFYRSLLNSCIGNETKTNEYIIEAKSNNIKILPVDVNKSCDVFVVEDGCLRFPLTGVKGIGNIFAQSFISSRKLIGNFQDVYQAIIYVVSSNGNNTILENMIKIGAFDSYAINRNSLLASLPEIMQYCRLKGKETSDQGILMIGDVEKPMIIIKSDDDQVNLDNEIKLTGVYFRDHPSKEVKLKMNCLTNLAEITNENKVEVVAMLTRVKGHKAKTGEDMAFLELSDESGTLDCVAMPSDYKKFASLIKHGKILKFSLFNNNKGSYLVRMVVE